MAERGESGGGDVINIKRFLVGSDCAADATELTVQAGGPWLERGALLWNARTDDYATVNSKPTGNRIPIKKSALGTTGQVWKQGDKLWAK